MGKTTKRVLSMLLTVLMVLSMVSVFTVPVAAAVLPEGMNKLDYDALFKNKDTFLINGAWSNLSSRKAGDTLSFTFRGENKSVAYNPKKHFASYKDAYETIWAGLSAENYFTYNPVIIFAPGTYSDNIAIHAPAIILGANAGISPNAEVAEEDWNISWLMENGGDWAANPARKSETVFTNRLWFSTRAQNTDNEWTKEVMTGDAARFQLFRELACNANAGRSLDYIVDGIESKATIAFNFTGIDVNKTVTYNGKSASVPGGRSVKLFANNILFTGATSLANAHNTNNDYYDVKFDNLRSTGTNVNFLDRYVNYFTATNSYITGWTGSFLNSSLPNAKHEGTSFTMEHCVISKGPSGNTAVFSGESKKTGFTLNLENNLIYNISGANYGTFRIDSKSAIDTTINVLNNEIYHDASVNTYFNGNPDYVTAGRYTINFNGNKVISPTLANIPPNSEYDPDKSSTMLFYNFDGNFFSDSVDGAGKPVTFVHGPKENGDLASGWNYRDPSYFYDYDMEYSSAGTKIIDADFGEGNLVEVTGDTIIARCINTKGVIEPKFFFDEKNIGSVLPEIEFATDEAFENVITEIDLDNIGDVANYYVRAYYKDTDYPTREYKVQIVAATPVDFNEMFMAEGMSFAGYDLEFINTAVLVGESEFENGEEVSYGFVNGTYYKFKVDNFLVFSSINKAASQMGAVEDPIILLPSGRYSKMTLPFAAVYLGTNAEIDPVDDSASVKADGSDWSLGNGWGDSGQTELASVNIADGVEGTLIMKGVTLRGQFNDTLRTYGSKGEVYGTLDIVLENTVLDQSVNGTVSNDITDDVIAEGLSGSTVGNYYAFNLMNRRSVNFDEVQPEPDGKGGKTDEVYAGFGDTYNDSFTIKNLWVKDSTLTRRFLHEWLPAHVTLDNIYYDIEASGAQQGIFGWLKTGYLNKNSSLSIVNCNFRNAPEFNNDHPFIGLEGASGAPSDKKIGSILEADAKYDVVVENNIFVNACRDIKTGTQSYLLLSPAYMSSIKINNNFALNEDKPTIIFIGNLAKHAPGLASQDAPVRGNIEISGNDIIGFMEGSLKKSFGLDKDEPALKDTFYTTDIENYLTNETAGVYDSSMGGETYWFDFARTKGSNDYKIQSITGKTDDVSGIFLDNVALNFGATIKAGKLSDLEIELPEGATGKWSEYVDGVLVDFEDKAIEDIGSFATFVYTMTKDEEVNVYNVTIYTTEHRYFVDEFEANESFDNTAVILSSEAKTASTGSFIFETWYDKYGTPVEYTFTVGVNAFGSLNDAVKSSSSVLVSKDFADKEFANGTRDFTVYGPAKIYAPNYNVSPVITDGFGATSPSHGDDWAFDAEFANNKQVVVRNIIVDSSAKGEIALYGFTVTGSVTDKTRIAENDANITLNNTYFTGTGINSHRSLFDFAGENLKKPENKSSFTVNNAYFDIPKSTYRVRLIGGNAEIAPAALTFDTIYLDLENSAVQTDPGYLRSVATESSFTIRNSLIKNSDATNKNSLITFDGYVNDPVNAVATAGGTWRAGRLNAITYENNIFDGFTTINGNAAYLMDMKYPYAYTDVTIKDNYILGANGQSVSLFRTGSTPENAPSGFKPVYTITGNTINGMGNEKYEVTDGNYVPSFFNWIIKDNFVTYLQVANVYADGTEAHVPAFNAGNMQDGRNLEYSHKLDARNLVSTKQVYDMTYVGGVTVSGDTLTVNLPDGTGVIEDGKITVANIIKTNSMHNILRVKAADGYHDAREAVAIADNLVFEVRSADGKTDIKSYKLKINVVEKAQAFKDTFVDATPIVNDNGVEEPILRTAFMVSAAFSGKTVVNADWMGESYSFTVGENAFATVKEALDYAKSKSLTNVQILFKNDSAAVVNIGITYPCKIYTENYNTLPYVTDGYGTESESHGEGWLSNPEYLDNQTIAEVVWLDANFTGKFELNGFTLNSSFVDVYRTQGYVADVTLRNTRIDAVNLASVSTKNKIKAITGVTASGDKNWVKEQIFMTGCLSNFYDAGNRFVIKNMHFANAGGSRIDSHFAQYTEFDGLYLNDMAAIDYNTTASNIRQSVAESTMIFKNCNFQKFNPTRNSLNQMVFFGTNNADSNLKIEDTQTLIFDNNIFNSFETRTGNSGQGYLINIHMFYFKQVTLTNNYIATPYNASGNTNLELFNLNETAANAAKIKTDIEISNNVFNSITNVEFKRSNAAISTADASIKVENNYMASTGYDANVIENNPVGAEMTVASGSNNTVGAYALNYERTIKSTDVVYPTFAALENLVIENDSAVSYITADGTLPETIGHIIEAESPYSDVKLVVDGVEKELDASIAGAATVALRVYSKDETAHKDIAVNGVTSTNHVFVDYVFNNDSTCEYDGTETATCTGACGIEGCDAKHTAVKPDSKAEHKVNKLRGIPNGDATCQTNGTIRYVCTVCGETVNEEIPESTIDHEYINFVDKGSATCSSFGTEEGECKWCGTKGEREKLKGTLNKKAHSFGDWIYNNDVTCYNNGTETRTCTGCHSTETRNSDYYTTDKAEHSLSEFKYDGNATCHTDGTMTARCTNEGCRYKVVVADPNFKANPALHTFGEFVNDNNATCCENGTETATCTVCGSKKTVEIAGSAKGHEGGAAALTDVKGGKWYTDAINYVVAHEYISGISKTEFGINVNITRGMFVTILARIAGVDTSTAANKKATTKFTDVKSGKYYTAAVAWANANGVVSGKTATTFEPNANISRQELAVMIVNFAKAQNITLKATAKAVTFADASSIAKWAKEEVALCQKAGIISGYNEGGKTYFKPTNTATRAEAAQMIYKFVTEYVDK